MQFFKAEVIRAPPQWPPFGVSLRRDVRAKELATRRTPDSRRRPFKDGGGRGGLVVLDDDVLGFRVEVGGERRTAGIGGPGAGADRVPGFRNGLGRSAAGFDADQLLAGRRYVASDGGLVLLLFHDRFVDHDLVPGRGRADDADHALAQAVRQTGLGPAGRVERFERAYGEIDAFAEGLAERSWILRGRRLRQPLGLDRTHTRSSM